jgi:hypothetical protein
MNRLLLPLASALLLAGCGTLGIGGGDRDDRRGPPAPEFAGRSIEVVAASGQTTRLAFRRDGRVVAHFNGRETEGRWALERRRLCFTWAGNFRECWPYRTRFERGRTRTITSDRGNVVRVTLR